MEQLSGALSKTHNLKEFSSLYVPLMRLNCICTKEEIKASIPFQEFFWETGLPLGFVACLFSSVVLWNNIYFIPRTKNAVLLYTLMRAALWYPRWFLQWIRLIPFNLFIISLHLPKQIIKENGIDHCWACLPLMQMFCVMVYVAQMNVPSEHAGGKWVDISHFYLCL